MNFTVSLFSFRKRHFNTLYNFDQKASSTVWLTFSRNKKYGMVYLRLSGWCQDFYKEVWSDIHISKYCLVRTQSWILLVLSKSTHHLSHRNSCIGVVHSESHNLNSLIQLRHTKHCFWKILQKTMCHQGVNLYNMSR